MKIFNKFFENDQHEQGRDQDKKNENQNEEIIREIAYFRWLAATGGSPVSEEESQKFWFEAKEQV